MFHVVLDRGKGQVQIRAHELVPSLDDHGGIAPDPVPEGLPEPFDGCRVHHSQPNAPAEPFRQVVGPQRQRLEFLPEVIGKGFPSLFPVNGGTHTHLLKGELAMLTMEEEGGRVRNDLDPDRPHRNMVPFPLELITPARGPPNEPSDGVWELKTYPPGGHERPPGRHQPGRPGDGPDPYLPTSSAAGTSLPPSSPPRRSCCVRRPGLSSRPVRCRGCVRPRRPSRSGCRSSTRHWGGTTRPSGPPLRRQKSPSHRLTLGRSSRCVATPKRSSPRRSAEPAAT